MPTFRRVMVGVGLVALGAALGFTAALMRPRTYADFAGARQP